VWAAMLYKKQIIERMTLTRHPWTLGHSLSPESAEMTIPILSFLLSITLTRNVYIASNKYVTATAVSSHLSTQLICVQVIDLHRSAEWRDRQLKGVRQQLGTCHVTLPSIDGAQVLQILQVRTSKAVNTRPALGAEDD
jgi:hypothetical protein